MENLGPNFSASVPIETFAALGFCFMVIIYVIFAIVLHYHWQQYGTDARVSKLTMWSFFVTTLPFLIIMGLVTLILW